MKKHFITLISLIIIFSACKKDSGNASSPQTSADFIKNTEWVGTLDRRGFEYPPPCALKFHDDNSFTLYSHFVLLTGGVETRVDSITATIQNIDDEPDGSIRITTDVNTTFFNIITKYMYITNRNTLVGFSDDATQPPTFQLEIFPAEGIAVYGTHWRGPEWHSTPSTVAYAYPDLTSIHFLPDGINTSYTQNGQPVFLAQNTPLQHIYQQNGSRVYMSGYTILPGGAAITVNNYFGVLLPSGNAMLVDSNSPDAHLPNYVNTFEPYGPNGATPTIYKY